MQHLRVLVGSLRQKLGEEATAPRFILTEPGVGYRFIAS
jgi:two-component system KDP operon response regulator KdpE